VEKIGFYGGCFNPPTRAHIQLAIKVLQNYKLDKIFFVPVGNAYNKKELADEQHRYNMLKIAIQNEPNLEILDIELNQNKNFKAIDVFKLINNKFKNSQNYFIMGADNFQKIENWKDYQTLISEFNYIVLSRENIGINKNKNKNVHYFKKCQIDCSSTQVREYIKQSNIQSLQEYIDNNVLNYIMNNQLYLYKKEEYI